MNYFTEEEFMCKCGCNIVNVENKFLEQLIVARMLSEIPFYITSGCRCPSHNEETGSKPTSSHVTTKDKPCYAADIRAVTSSERYEILTSLITAGFDRIGIAKTFIHVDMDPNKAPEVSWVY